MSYRTLKGVKSQTFISLRICLILFPLMLIVQMLQMDELTYIVGSLSIILFLICCFLLFPIFLIVHILFLTQFFRHHPNAASVIFSCFNVEELDDQRVNPRGEFLDGDGLKLPFTYGSKSLYRRSHILYKVHYISEGEHLVYGKP